MKLAAKRIGIVPVTLRRIEAGLGNPSLSVLLSIARSFRISLPDLLRARSSDH